MNKLYSMWDFILFPIQVRCHCYFGSRSSEAFQKQEIVLWLSFLLACWKVKNEAISDVHYKRQWEIKPCSSQICKISLCLSLLRHFLLFTQPVFSSLSLFFCSSHWIVVLSELVLSHGMWRVSAKNSIIKTGPSDVVLYYIFSY